MTPADARSRLEVMPYDECVDLLAAGTVGRLGGTWDDEPHIVPLNYRWDGAGVVFRTDPGTTLRSIVDRTVVFEIDTIDDATHTGWSVIVRGRGLEIDLRDPAEAETPGGVPEAAPVTWAPGARDHWVRITPTAISGRRITRADESDSQWWRLPARD
jgi:nitroimidazol reductase NimA-like FMN-containing flavoprotein (pyridoxamine 5'-phosphate oxidase superfamily)